MPDPFAQIDVAALFIQLKIDRQVAVPENKIRAKGWAVRPLKRYVSWVQNVVRQFGPYPVQA